MESWKIYKDRFSILVAITALPLVIAFLGGFCLGLLGYSDTVSFKSLSLPLQLFFVGFVVLVILVSIWSFAAVIENIKSREELLPLKESYTKSSHFLLPLIGTSILTGLAVLGGTILFIVPGIIFAFWFSQSQFVVMTENISGKAAMKQSKFYVKGNVAEIFVKGLYIAVITLGIAVAIALVSTPVNAIYQNTFFANILSIVFNLLWTPLVTIYSFLLFGALQKSKIQT